MRQFVGIDLGTTNSAICCYDGVSIRLFKSPEQNDVTPSAIYIGKRGNKYIGQLAYDYSAREPENAATLFKRLIGSKTPIRLSGATLTPEECSAEILRVLFGYLPEEIRNDPETGTVITAPAAFNQMQKDATMSAAEMARIGRVALMQEPVAAVMCVMRQRKGDGIFLVYDLGGGTLDIAIAESISGRVNLLAHGGKAMCGGRDFDRIIFDNLVKPWLLDNFNLPNDLVINPKFKTMTRMATWVAEKAKISLSARENVLISDPTFDAMGFKDASGKDIFLEIPFTRAIFDDLISGKIAESLEAALSTMEKAGLSSQDIERIVFVGGPTSYKPIRDKISFELGIASSTEVNPMTAVAEGAAVFAESVDWNSHNRGRKNSRGLMTLNNKLDISLNYLARTPNPKSRIAIKLGGSALSGYEFQVDSLDTGWCSGRMALVDNATVDVMLTKQGENIFKVWIFDESGGPLTLENQKISITYTAAVVDAIPASSSIGIEVLNKLGGHPVLSFLVREGDRLPARGGKAFKAGTTLRAGGSGALRFKIWEGEIQDNVRDNRFVGDLIITGDDFDEGVINQGAELKCEYEVLDSGNIRLDVTVPCIGNSFRSDQNFYSRDSGEIDFTDAAKIIMEEVRILRERTDAISDKVDDKRIDQARAKLNQASSIRADESDPETAKSAMDSILDAKKLLAKIRSDNQKEIRQIDLNRCMAFFDSHVRKYANQTDASSFDTLSKTAQRSIDSNSNDFENHLSKLRGKNFMILWRQDWFVIDRFKMFADRVYLFRDKRQHAELIRMGNEAVRKDDMEALRQVVYTLDSSRTDFNSDDDMLADANIVGG